MPFIVFPGEFAENNQTCWLTPIGLINIQSALIGVITIQFAMIVLSFGFVVSVLLTDVVSEKYSIATKKNQLPQSDLAGSCRDC